MRRPLPRLNRGRVPAKGGIFVPPPFAITNPADLASVLSGVPIAVSGTSPGVAAVSVTGNAVAIGSSPVVANAWSVPWTPGAAGPVALAATDGALSANISVTVVSAVAFAFTNPADLATVANGVPITVSGTSPGVASVTVTANAVAIGTAPVVAGAWSFSWTPTVAGATTLAATDGALNAVISVTVTASGYSPATDSSVRGWFDMLDPAAFVQSAGVMVSIRNKFNAEDWASMAGLAFPTFNATGLNGRPCMAFAAALSQAIGRAEAAVCGVFGPANPTYTAVFILANELADIGSRMYFSAARSTSTKCHGFGQHSTGSGVHTGTRIDDAAASLNMTAVPPPLTTPHSIIWVGNGAVTSLYVNGVALTVTASAATGIVTLDRASFGGRWDSAFDSPWGGTMGEAVFCNVAKSPAEVAAIHAYAVGKWGVPP